MLYNNFVACMMTCAVFGLLYMIDNQDWQYIIFPIGILIWGTFKFFDANDRKFLEGLGINPDDFNAFLPDYYNDYNYGNDYRHSTHNHYTSNNNHYIEDNWDSPSDTRRDTSSVYAGGFGKYNSGSYNSGYKYQDPLYKSIASKCKRNFKITIDNTEKKENEPRERIFQRIYHHH